MEGEKLSPIPTRVRSMLQVCSALKTFFPSEYCSEIQIVREDTVTHYTVARVKLAAKSGPWESCKGHLQVLLAIGIRGCEVDDIGRSKGVK